MEKKVVVLASDWSRRALAGAQRGIAKGLWAVSTRLGRAAHRLETAGLAQSIRNSQLSSTRNEKPEPPAEVLADEICTPHLA